MSLDPTTVTLTWTPRAADLANAELARTRDVGGAGARAAIAVLLAVTAATLLAYRVTAALGAVLIGCALLLVFLRMSSPMMRRRWAALLEANPALADRCEATFDATGVLLSGDRATHSRTWAAFTAWSDTPDAVVLSTSASAMGNLVVVPHRAATERADVDRLRHIVASHLGPPQGAVSGRLRTSLFTWTARAVVIGCLVVPLGVGMARVHDEGGEWSPWASEAPPRLTRDGATYVREGGPTSRPSQVAGSEYTPGGGLVLVTLPQVDVPPPELWVLDHDGVYRHYVLRVAGDAEG